MTFLIANDSIDTGVRYDLSLYESLLVPIGVTIISSTNTAIYAAGSAKSARIFGFVGSPLNGIRADPANGTDRLGSNIFVGSTGAIDGFLSAIQLNGSGNRVVNYGQLSSTTNGIDIQSPGVDDAARITNYGTITAGTAINSASGGQVSVFNYGRINGIIYAIDTRGGQTTSGDYIYNRGQIDGTVTLGEGDDTLLNRSLIIGTVDMGDGDDFVDNRGGTIERTITLGAGADVFMPGASEEFVVGGGDQYDRIDFSKSGGVQFALDGSIDGTGVAAGDTYIGFTDVTGSTLGSDVLIGDAGINTLRGLGGNDTISGQAGVDFLYGGAGNDTLDGGADADALYGGAGNDTLIGGDDKSDFLAGEAGNDRLISGGGSDILAGGTGADTFVYTATSDFGGTALGTREQLNDFNRLERDKIDLSALDASTKAVGNQAFTSIGTTAFSNVAGQLRFEVSDTFITVQGDLNGDGVADIAFDLNGITSVLATDFVL